VAEFASIRTPGYGRSAVSISSRENGAWGEQRRQGKMDEARKIAASSASPPSRVNPSVRNLRPRPRISFALRYGLVHALASASIGNSTPGQVGPLSTPCASAAALVAFSLKREEFRMRSTPLIMTSAILIEHHSETNADTFITVVTKPVQTLALT
jgi:hypothetical protein